MSKLRLDFNFVVGKNIHQNITENEFINSKNLSKAGYLELMNLVKEDRIGFPLLPKRNISQIVSYAKDCKGKFNDLILVGIGGSSLGLEAIVNALLPFGFNGLSYTERGCFPRIWVADNPDPHKIYWIKKHCEPSDTLICVISKSGSTVETIANFSVFYEWMKSKVENHKEHILVITDEKNGDLRKFAIEEELNSFVVPQNVGGRFSVLSDVGMVTATLLGIDVLQLLKGADDLYNNYQDMIISLSAIYLHYLNKGYNINVLMPYSSRLEKFAEWFCQLWGESLGKKVEDRRFGSTPVKAVGAIDQHSQIQLYKDGPFDKLLTFIAVSSHDRIENVLPFYNSYSYLKNTELGELLNLELKSTELALFKEGKPSIKINVESIDEYTLGMLFMLFQVTVAVVGLSLKINPFDQPGVEEGKKFAYGLLGREGFEEKKEEFEKIYKKFDDYII
jgi:glucose-6-phosphate isomerase